MRYSFLMNKLLLITQVYVRLEFWSKKRLPVKTRGTYILIEYSHYVHAPLQVDAERYTYPLHIIIIIAYMQVLHTSTVIIIMCLYMHLYTCMHAPYLHSHVHAPLHIHACSIPTFTCTCTSTHTCMLHTYVHAPLQVDAEVSTLYIEHT